MCETKKKKGKESGSFRLMSHHFEISGEFFLFFEMILFATSHVACVSFFPPFFEFWLYIDGEGRGVKYERKISSLPRGVVVCITTRCLHGSHVYNDL